MSGLRGLGGLGHAEPEPPRTHRRTGLAVVAVAVVLLVAVLAGGGYAAHRFLGAFGSSDYSGEGTGSVVVQVHDGDSARQIGQTLVDDGVVASVGAFTSAAEANPRSSSIGPGFYRLHRQMKASLALGLLLDPSSLVQSKVTIPEGSTATAILATIAKEDPEISLASLQAAAKDPTALGVPAWGKGHLEGFLWPATYDFAPGTTATLALTQMVQAFTTQAASLHLTASHGLSAYGVLTLASVVQREGRLTSDFPQIAEVFLNRIARGMPLGSNATLYYVLGPGHGALTSADLALDSPYNTENRPGLPPTPINSPGAAAINAVLHAPSGPYLYFVTIDKAGHTGFATTYAQFQQLVAESRRNGVS